MVEIRFEREQNRSAAYDGNRLIGFCEVQMTDCTWTIPHTEVDLAYSGQGIARKLVLCVAELAENEGVEVVPICPYAKSILR